MMSFFILFLISLINAQNLKGDALEFYNSRNYLEALKLTESEVKINPKNMDARVIMIWSLIGLEQYERAERESLIGLDLRKYDVRLIETLAEAYFFQGKYQNALKRFQEYIFLAPQGGRIARVYYFLGETYSILGQNNKASFAYEMALKYFPSNQDWNLKLARTQIKTNSLKLAEKSLETILSVNPYHSEAKNLLESIKNK